MKKYINFVIALKFIFLWCDFDKYGRLYTLIFLQADSYHLGLEFAISQDGNTKGNAFYCIAAYRWKLFKYNIYFGLRYEILVRDRKQAGDRIKTIIWGENLYQEGYKLRLQLNTLKVFPESDIRYFKFFWFTHLAF